MYYTQEERPRKSSGILIAIVIVLAIDLGAAASYIILKVNEPERVPGRIIEKTSVQYNVDDDTEVQIAKNNLYSTVEIEVLGRTSSYSGTGFIVDYINDTAKNAQYPVIMTNYHVISAAVEELGYKIHIKLFDKATFFGVEAKVIGYDSEIDIAVLKLEIDLADVQQRVIKFGNSRDLQYGQRVVAIGNALGGGLSVTAGEISIPEVVQSITLEGNLKASGTIQHFIQTSAAINSGNSGGVLLDMKDHGRVIGINTYKAIADTASGVNIPADNVGLAVPSNMAKAILDYIKAESNNFANKIGEVSAARDFELNFNSLMADMDGNYNNVLKAQKDIKFSAGFFAPVDISKDDAITQINGINIDKFHTGTLIPSPSIFSELVLYYGSTPTNLDVNFYRLNLTINNKTTLTIPNMYLQREIPWISDFLQ